jgi:hypothetical protein
VYSWHLTLWIVCVLLTKLSSRKRPLHSLNTFELCFKISSTCVKWESYLSLFSAPCWCMTKRSSVATHVCHFYRRHCWYGPASNFGCYVHFICCAIFLYADDIILLAPSVAGLQLLLATCERYLSEIGMNINVSKSTCNRFGPRFNNNVCEKLRLCDGEQLDWCVRCKYSGVYLVSSTSFGVLFDIASGHFFRWCNAIFSRVRRLASEEVAITLLRPMCFTNTALWYRVLPTFFKGWTLFRIFCHRKFMYFFRTNSSLTVKECQKALRFLPRTNVIDIRTASFLQRSTENIICDIFSTNAADRLRHVAGL